MSKILFDQDDMEPVAIVPDGLDLKAAVTLFLKHREWLDRAGYYNDGKTVLTGAEFVENADLLSAGFELITVVDLTQKKGPTCHT